MSDIYVLDQDFRLQGIIDQYVSAIWRPAYTEVGDFELYLSATNKAVDLLQENRYVVRRSDITVENGVTTYKKVMIIKNLQLSTDVENGDYLRVTGRELKYILHQRIVWQQTNISGTVDNAISKLITDNAISPTDSNRIIPTLTMGAVTGRDDTIVKQVTGDYLDQAIVDICTAYNYGWCVCIINNALTVELYKGVDRSYNQSERPYVVFSDKFDNLYNTEYQLQTEQYANCTLIGGEGEGLERVYTTVNNAVSGLERYETFTDARDISQNKDSEEAIDLTTYISLLAERGREKLASLSMTEGFSGEMLSDVAFKYGEDFYLGDTVTVINEYGIGRNVIVLSAIESHDENGTKLVPQFNI